jgi:hypothetical protein
MSMIRKQSKPIPKITLSLRLEEPLVRRLKRFAIFWESEPAFIIAELLSQLIDGHKDFKKWCEAHPEQPPVEKVQKAKSEAKAQPSNGSLVSGASAPAVSAIQAAR